jgi:TPP-dependent pyruvate/acetoin dehydrogenase alpha subunit
MKSTIRQPGSAASATPAEDTFSLISNEKLLAIYATMLKCRVFAERSHILINKSKLSGKKRGSKGHEAAVVGVTIDLHPDDAVIPQPGDLIPAFVAGLPLNDFLVDSATAPKPQTAVRLKLAIDSAIAHKGRNNKRIVVAFGTGNRTTVVAWHKAMNFAGIHCLPIIFVSWNGLSAQPSQSDAHEGGKRAQPKGGAFAFPAIVVDGTDAVAVYRVAHEAIAHARMGHGPTLIECQIDLINPGDPISNMEDYLTAKGLFSSELKTRLAAGFSRELDAAMRSARKAQGSF